MSDGSTGPWWYRVPSVAVTLLPMVAVSLIVWALLGDGPYRVLVAVVCGVAAGWAVTAVRGAAQSAYDQRHDQR
ncbi:hypothetical protein [Streptomyces xanthochromogenes]